MGEYNALMYADLSGVSSGSTSLAGQDKPVFPTRLYALSPTSVTAGTALNWGKLRNLGLPWGPDTALRYSALQDGWSYVWNVNNGTLTVTDAAGTATVYTGIYTLKELGLPWGILRSVQFSLIFQEQDNADVFLIAAKSWVVRQSQQHSFDRMANDFLYEGIQHILFDRLCGHNMGDDGAAGNLDYDLFVIQTIAYYAIEQTVLFSKAQALDFVNVYPLDLLAGAEAVIGANEVVERTGQMAAAWTCLMIALFSRNLLAPGSKIIYEPWMLWAAFMWWTSWETDTASSRRIFDLSPRWG